MSSGILAGYKAIITAGGIGTRLLPFSKEIPKEMAPLIFRNSDNGIEVKPIIQAVFDQLFECGVRDFYIVVGKGKRAIQEHFNIDSGFLELLKRKNKSAATLEEFYERLRKSNIVFVNQPEALGFGDAVSRVKPHVNGVFLVHAGDTYIASENNAHIERMTKAMNTYKAEAVLVLLQVDDPRKYGVVIGEEIDEGILRVREAVEKPEVPRSRDAIMPVYLFRESIFNALEGLGPGKGGEIQLTDGIQRLISKGKDVLGVRLKEYEMMFDIGTPETLVNALKLSEKYFGLR